MGIGVSYTGNGTTRTFELDGVPPAGSLAEDVLGAQVMRAPRLAGSVAPPALLSVPSLSDDPDKGKVSLFDGDAPDVLSRKVLAGGSIAAGAGGLCLKGEEGGIPGGRRLYGVRDGVSGFFSLAEIDLGAGGVLLDGVGDTPDGAMAALDGHTGATLRVGGRTDVQIELTEAGDRFLVVKEFYRLADISPHGRVVRVSKEVERLLVKQPMGGGGGNGKYGVRPIWTEATETDENPMLDMLAFGSEADLDTWDGERFACNYENGSLKENPPVKIVVADTCAYNPLTGGE